MNIIYTVSQIAGFIAFILSLIAYHQKKKRKIFQTMIMANILDIIHYIMLGAYSGCITKIIAFIRNEIIIIKENNKKFNNKIILIILFAIYLVSGILTYKNIYSILPILAAMIYLYFVWNGNELNVKKVAFYCYFLWLIYNICVCSIAGITSNIFSIISTFIAIYNEKRLIKVRRLKKMDKYIIITTFCDMEEIANEIINTLLEKRLVAGTQISEVRSKYWWNNELEECCEYKLEFRTKESLFRKIETEIKKIHNYEVAEISYTEIKNGSKEFLNWIDSNI